jgi:predicted phosphoadenosine phosphosulfate sulfurtransferase
MTDPFLIDGPAVISFSGGRTSGYMLRRILDVGLQPDVHVLFADTGKERPETYDFVRACAAQWDVPIPWVHRPGYFTQLITDKKFLPNPVARFCTTELKLKPIAQWMESAGYTTWDTVIGMRADEPKRVATMRDRGLSVPLADAGVTKADVMAFWSRQPFDLALQPHESNCDLCFLKGVGKRRQIIRDHPELVGWWIEQEQRIGGRFRNNEPSYADIAAQPDLFAQPDESLTECFCHD